MEYTIFKHSELIADDVSLRIDAEHYRQEYLRIKKTLLKVKSQALLDFIDKPVMTGHTPSMQNERFYGGSINFIKTDNLREHYIDGDFTHKLSEEGNKIIKRSSLKENDVLITIIGATFQIVGRACLVKKKDLPANINQNIALIRVSNKLSPEYLTVYLNSYYGRNYLWYLSRQTEQVNLNCREVENLLIPIFSEKLISLISDVHKKAYLLNERSESLYKEAEQALLSELGLLNWKPKHRLSFVKNFSDTQTSERIDSEYFQPMYEEIIEAVKKYKGGFIKLGEVAKTKRGSLISDTFYSENKGTSYVRGADFSSGFLGDDKLIYIDNSFKPRNEIKIKKGDIVFALIGTVGATALVDAKFDGAFISNNLGKISTKNYNSTVLQILLHSIIGKKYFQKEQTQTAQPKISDKNIHGFILPLLKDEVIEKIETQYLESQKAKSLSKRLLDITKRGVEMAIEKSEKDAQSWINAELKKQSVDL